MAPIVVVLATLDTKARESRFLADRIRGLGAEVLVVNTGRSDSADFPADFGAAVVAAASTASVGDDESEKIRIMKRSASGARNIVLRLLGEGRADGVIAIGGGQGSWIASRAMRALPSGLPKVLVSTAGRDAGQYTQFSDIIPIFSITDVAGLNPLLRGVLTNAAAAIVGMAGNRTPGGPLPENLVAISVYGITTVGANVAMADLEHAGWDPVSFHANGVGGPTMEAQIGSGAFAAVLDWSITELADELLGGVCSAGPSRLTTAGGLGLPQLVVPGGMDVVNFGAPFTMPEQYRGRLSYAHTEDATLLRTDADENRATAKVVATRLNASVGPVEVLIPMLGFSALSAPGGALELPEADLAFADALESALAPTIGVTRVDANINDPGFARLAAGRMLALLPEHAPALSQ